MNVTDLCRILIAVEGANEHITDVENQPFCEKPNTRTLQKALSESADLIRKELESTPVRVTGGRKPK
ncbi:MAG: hypothetical protein KAJ19_02530 [Gammaproteobacteria bacterium]|nr:hypothetical protein [Gammaproteobacteria bacterium]